ncbi:MAG: cobyrinic acid a,c-diamide synthase, partial [Desulfovibrio sp.]|nr:cobyrinic acid a,c-diamide synthase [Desulfovibrio sp.]
LRVKGKQYAMANIFPVDVTFCEKPQGLGYVEAEVVGENPYFPCGLHIKGHEFHYSKPTTCQTGYSFKLMRGFGMGIEQNVAWDGLLYKQTFACYTHIFSPSVPCWAENFVNRARQYQQQKG